MARRRSRPTTFSEDAVGAMVILAAMLAGIVACVVRWFGHG